MMLNLIGLAKHVVTHLSRNPRGCSSGVATTCEFMQKRTIGSPERLLRRIFLAASSPDFQTPPSPWKPLDDIYLRILQQSVTPETPASRLERFRQILGTIVVATSPLSGPVIIALLSFVDSTILEEPDPVRDSLVSLQSVVLEPEHRDTIRILHPSFNEYITSASRCKDDRFYINPSLYNSQLFVASLSCMMASLRSRAYQHPDAETDDSNDLTHHLQYACISWSGHLLRSGVNIDGMLHSFRDFALHNLLKWLEVMCRLGAVDTAAHMLAACRKWVRGFFDDNYKSANSRFAAPSQKFRVKPPPNHVFRSSGILGINSISGESVGR